MSIEEKIAEIEARYKVLIDQVTSKTERDISDASKDVPNPTGVEAALGIDFDIKWKTKSFKLDLPQSRMERETIKFDVPQVRMETKEISFDVPSTRMVRKCIAKKPVFRSWKWYNECIYGKVPEVYMKRVSFKTDVPKISRRREEIKFDKPVFSMATKEIEFKVPQFYLKDVRVEIKEAEGKMNDVMKDTDIEIAKIQALLEKEIKDVVTQGVVDEFDVQRRVLVEQRQIAETEIEQAIGKAKSAISTLKKNQANDEVRRVEEQLAQIISEGDHVLAAFDEALESLEESEKQALLDASS